MFCSTKCCVLSFFTKKLLLIRYANVAVSVHLKKKRLIKIKRRVYLFFMYSSSWWQWRSAAGCFLNFTNELVAVINTKLVYFYSAAAKLFLWLFCLTAAGFIESLALHTSLLPYLWMDESVLIFVAYFSICIRSFARCTIRSLNMTRACWCATRNVATQLRARLCLIVSSSVWRLCAHSHVYAACRSYARTVTWMLTAVPLHA